jgi:hypothetical protein
MILEAVEDEDLAELDLPDQLATLKRISTSCIKDTQELKAKVDNWGAFAKSIHTACVDQDGRHFWVSGSSHALKLTRRRGTWFQKEGTWRPDRGQRTFSKDEACGSRREQTADGRIQKAACRSTSLA